MPPYYYGAESLSGAWCLGTSLNPARMWTRTRHSLLHIPRHCIGHRHWRVGGDMNMLGRQISDNGQLPLPLVKRIMLSILRGLAHLAQRGIVHTDVKPDNIMSRILMSWMRAFPCFHYYDMNVKFYKAALTRTVLTSLTESCRPCGKCRNVEDRAKTILDFRWRLSSIIFSTHLPSFVSGWLLLQLDMVLVQVGSMSFTCN